MTAQPSPAQPSSARPLAQHSPPGGQAATGGGHAANLSVQADVTPERLWVVEVEAIPDMVQLDALATRMG